MSNATRAGTVAALAVTVASGGAALGLALARSPHAVNSPAPVKATVAAVAITQSVSGCTSYMRAADKRDPDRGITAVLNSPSGPCKGLTDTQLSDISWNVHIPDAARTVSADLPCYSAMQRTHPELLPVQLRDICGG